MRAPQFVAVGTALLATACYPVVSKYPPGPRIPQTLLVVAETSDSLPLVEVQRRDLPSDTIVVGPGDRYDRADVQRDIHMTAPLADSAAFRAAALPVLDASRATRLGVYAYVGDDVEL